MKILAFDSALDGCSAAVLADGALLAERARAEPRGQAESLAPLVRATLADAGLAAGELDLLAVTIGPGTFTGLRIALALARGMALALRRPVRGVTTLQALAAAVPQGDRADRGVVAAIDARRSEIYLQAFAAGTMAPAGPPALVALADAAGRLPPGRLALVGSGARLLAEALPERAADLAAGPWPDRIQARAVAGIAAAAGPLSPDSPPPAPLYLRAPDAKLPTA